MARGEALKAWREANKGKDPLAEWRAKGEKVVRKNPLEKLAENPTSKVLAIKAYCWQCSNGTIDEVKHCTVTSCALHKVRPYQSKEDDE